jgi:ankyrin repeat protein
MLRLLCERADVLVNKQDETGDTALYWATYTGYVGCMRILLDVGRANVNALSYRSRTALHIAAYTGHLEAAALLIERGAKVNLVNVYRETPLDRVNEFGHYSAEMVALLKSKGAKRASELPQPST